MKHYSITLNILLLLLITAYAAAISPTDSVEMLLGYQQTTSDNKPAFLCLASTEPSAEQSTELSAEQLDSDPNQPVPGDPNGLVPDLLDTLPLPDPNAQSLPEVDEPQKYWQPQYHRQVNQRTFMILNYPYYHDGRNYPVERWRQYHLYDEWKGLYDEPNEVAAGDTAGTKSDIDRTRLDMEECCDMIHQWRSINELPQTALEIVRAVELTKTNTQIYRRKPELAIKVKRTVGQIGQVNKSFDLISRITMQGILKGQTDKIYLSRMRKQIADLISYLDRLATQNDDISIELGVGKIDRSKGACPNSRNIDYSHSVIIEEQ